MAIAEAWFCAQWPIFVLFLRFVFGLLSGWKIQTWPIIRFISQSLVLFFYLLVFDIIHDAMCLSKMSRTYIRNIGPQHKKNNSMFHCTHGVLFIPVFTKLILSVISFLVSSDHRSRSHLKFQSCLITEYAGVYFWMSKDNFSWNPPKQHVVNDVGAVWPFFETQLFSAILQLWSLKTLTQTLLLIVH